MLASYCRAITEVTQIPTITLHANMSDESLELKVISKMPGKIDCSVTINARIWDGDHDQSTSLMVDHLVLSASRLCELRKQIEAWLDSKNVGTVAFSGEYSLAAQGSSRLDLNFGTRMDVIASGDKPVVTVIFKTGRINGEFCFVTDQSCLKLFAEDVVRAMPVG